VGDWDFADSEVQEILSDEDVEVEKSDTKQRRWLTPLLAGTGLGIAIALSATHMIGSRGNVPKGTTNQAIQQKANPSMTVTLGKSESAKVERSLNVTGTVAARNLTPVLPQANGLQVKQTLVEVGSYVKAGQPMAILDDSLLQEQIRQARADVESKEADTSSKQADLLAKQAAVSASQAAVKQREADLIQAKARLLDAQRSHDRNQKLLAEGAISQQLLDTAETNLAAARAAVQQSEANITNSQANVASAEAAVRTARANIESAVAITKSNSAKVEQYRTQLKQTIVRAPVSGMVAEKLIRVGDITGTPPQTQVSNIAGGTQKLFSIIQDGQLELQAQVPEVSLPQVRVGASVEVTSNRDQQVRVQGKVREIDPVINQQRREALVKIDVPATKSLQPGMFAIGTIATTVSTSVAVPQKAIQPQPDGSSFVFIFGADDKVRSQKVEVGEILSGERVEIKTGLKLGEKVVVDGAGYIKDGDTVRVAK
jgi:HlyD family secretion protein